MRYLTFSLDSEKIPRLGVMHADRVVDVQSLSSPTGFGPLPGSLLELIAQGPTRWARLAEMLRAELPRNDAAARHDPAKIRWHAPIPRPAKNVFCVGRNYVSHIEEQAKARGQQVDIPKIPVYFSKAPTTVNGPFDDVTYSPATTQMVDWEAELGVIIGVTGRDIARNAALRHVFGYTAINDVTARDLQKNHFQFFKGKSLDGFCPMGPVVVTPDEFGDPQQKDVITRVNGVEKQHSSTSKMIFPVDVLIESLSQGLTLEAGDIIATGTPDGVGFGRVPQEFLLNGHILETEVEGIGTMRNRIVTT
jgi:2-keto-4-pentenoate hydratase/2-oxohepta-3-ene-1,7-dioic acid hydratase in catechol pathway